MIETLGGRLIALMRRAALKNGPVAEAANVHIKTVSHWRNDTQVPEDAQIEAIVALLAARGVETTAAFLRYGAASRGSAVHDAMLGDEAARARRRWIAHFRADLIELYALDPEIAAAEALVEAPEVLAFMRIEKPDASLLDAMQWIGDVVKREVARRHGRTEEIVLDDRRRSENLLAKSDEEIVKSLAPKGPAIWHDATDDVAQARARADEKTKAARLGRVGKKPTGKKPR